MSLTWDEKTAVYLSLAEPKKVWMLLDTFSPDRFSKIARAKRGIVHAISEDELDSLRQGTFLEIYEREVSRDSRRCLWPSTPIGERELPLLTPLARMGYLLRQLKAAARERIVNSYERELAQILQRRMDQRWKLTPEARQKLFQSVKFDSELFDSFSLRAPLGVAEWLIDKVFFGLRPMAQLTELSLMRNGMAEPSKRRFRARRGDSGPGESGLTRAGQLAIVLMSLPPEVSAQLFKEMGPDMVQAITLEISKLPPISPELREQVVEEVTALSLAEWEATAREQAEPMGEYLRRYFRGEPG